MLRIKVLLVGGHLLYPWAVEIFRCPEHGTPLAEDEDVLRCTHGHSYAVTRQIPRFAGDEYAASFGFEWTTFSRTQLDYEQGQAALEDLRDKAGLTKKDAAGKIVLEAGCGAGRHSVWLADWGARLVAVDMSGAVEAAQENVQGKAVQVVQADLTHLPIAEESFDVVISIGVLHHTPDTRVAFQALVPLVKPGGRVSIWVYSTETATFGGELLRRFTPKMDRRRLLRLCQGLARLYPLYRFPATRRLMGHLIPISMHPHYEWRVLDTFDWYSPTYQWKHTYNEVREWFREAGLERVTALPFPVSMTGTKPGAERA